MVRSGAGHNLLLLGLPAPHGDDDDDDNNHYDDDDDDDDNDDDDDDSDDVVTTGERPTSYQPPLMQCSTPRAPIALPLISRSKSSSAGPGWPAWLRWIIRRDHFFNFLCLVLRQLRCSAHRICFASYVLISRHFLPVVSPIPRHVSNQTNIFLSPTGQHVYPTPSYLCCFQLFYLLCVFTSNPK